MGGAQAPIKLRKIEDKKKKLTAVKKACDRQLHDDFPENTPTPSQLGKGKLRRDSLPTSALKSEGDPHLNPNKMSFRGGGSRGRGGGGFGGRGGGMLLPTVHLVFT
jgi:hypothetical protein